MSEVLGRRRNRNVLTINKKYLATVTCDGLHTSVPERGSGDPWTRSVCESRPTFVSSFLSVRLGTPQFGNKGRNLLFFYSIDSLKRPILPSSLGESRVHDFLQIRTSSFCTSLRSSLTFPFFCLPPSVRAVLTLPSHGRRLGGHPCVRVAVGVGWYRGPVLRVRVY